MIQIIAVAGRRFSKVLLVFFFMAIKNDTRRGFSSFSLLTIMFCHFKSQIRRKMYIETYNTYAYYYISRAGDDETSVGTKL